MMKLEHVNITVPDPRRTAKMLIDLFDWHIRWEGTAINGGFTIHVGTDDQYLAVYTGPKEGAAQSAAQNSYLQVGGLNHIGIVVDDLDMAEKKVMEMGFETHSHADYEPGRRFYFHDADGIEFELIDYA